MGVRLGPSLLPAKGQGLTREARRLSVHSAPQQIPAVGQACAAGQAASESKQIRVRVGEIHVGDLSGRLEERALRREIERALGSAVQPGHLPATLAGAGASLPHDADAATTAASIVDAIFRQGLHKELR